MGNKTWKPIKLMSIGMNVKCAFACRKCGYVTTFLGKGKYPSYGCPECEKGSEVNGKGNKVNT